jgi:hypothetical protein
MPPSTAGGKLAPDLATSNVVASSVGQVAALWNQALHGDGSATAGTPWRSSPAGVADL